MLWKKLTKKGSYLVEAVIVIPIFIMATAALISMVPITAACENMVFAAADEMRFECLKSAFRKNPSALPPLLSHRIKAENTKLTDYDILAYRYLYRAKGVEDLIFLKFCAELKEKNPLGLFDSVRFSGAVSARAFTGKVHKRPPDGAGEDTEKEDKTVYIFPEWGMKYHNKQCTYVKANCRMVYLSQETKGDYTPCRLCKASSAQIGSPVFCFGQSGKAYHLAGCRMVKRYYVEIEKKKAQAQGYSPCSKCGGG